MIPPLRIALSGGGMKGLAHVGALEVLQERGLLRCVKEYIGTSAGALISFCMTLGYTLSELRTLCTMFDFTLLQNLDPETILQFPERFGLDDGKNVEKLLGILMRTKGISPDLTFEEVVGALPTTPRLRVYAVDVHACSIKEFSLEKTPRVPILQAIRASISIPFVFTPVCDIETGHVLVDGGLIAHFPFHHLSDREREETIGIAFHDADRVKEMPIPEGDCLKVGLAGYILQLYWSAYYPQNVALYKAWAHRILFISCGQFPAVHFDASIEQKCALIHRGREGAEEFLKRCVTADNRQIPVRRYSVS